MNVFLFPSVEIKSLGELSVTGFSAYAVDVTGDVAGSFEEDNKEVLIGTCMDVLTYSQETHGAFHKMADYNRRSVVLKWNPDGYNHGPVKFM